MTTMEFYLKDVWSKTLDLVEKTDQIDKEIFDYYFMKSKLLSLDNDNATVLVPFAIHYALMSQKKDVIESCLEQICGQHFPIHIIKQEELEEQQKQNTSFTNDFIIKSIDPEFTFGNFIVGRSNGQAQIAALTCATNPGMLYNPLFIYGNSGLGKTHLLNAIGNHVLVNNKQKRIGLISGMDFVEAVHKASEEKRLDEFKNSFNNLDILLVDDIQFIGGSSKIKTHEVFFSVFKNLIDNRKQVVICSDRAPADIEGLEDRIISRFNQGLKVNIEAPEYETSMDILRMKISNSANKLNVDEEVLSYIATNFSQDVRSLEGAIITLLFNSINFYSNEEKITLKMAIDIFKDQITNTSNELSISSIRRVVCDYYNLTKQQIISKTRTKNIANARHIAMYLCRKLLDAPFKDIGNEFGKRDHSTVMSSCERIEKLIKTEPLYLKAINDIENRLKQ